MQLRRRLRIKFVRNYKALCDKVFSGKIDHTSYKTESGMEVMRLMRKLIGYRVVGNEDIFWTMYWTWLIVYNKPYQGDRILCKIQKAHDELKSNEIYSKIEHPC